MKIVKVLGSGCKKCEKTADIISDVAVKQGLEIEVIKETDAATIMAYGVMSTPAVVIDEKLVHSGSVPAEDQIKLWLAAAP